MNLHILIKAADYFFNKLGDSNFPASDNIFPIIQSVVNSLKSNPLLQSVVQVAQPVDVQNTIDNSSLVYFQLIVKPEKYQQMINEPEKSTITNLLKSPSEEALKTKFPAFNFKVKVGIVS